MRPNSPRPALRLIPGAALAGALVTAAFLALLWKDPLLCWNDDYQISILPVLSDVARAWREGSWPLLSPYAWNCANLAGEYQYGTFSVFVNAVVSAVFAFNPSYPNAAAALAAAHLFALGAGAFLLGKRRRLSNALATLVALSGALNGWLVCWGATDWFGALAALTWLPWAWWALEVSIDPAAPRWRWLLPAPFVYLLVSAGFPYTVLSLGIVTGWLALREWSGRRRPILDLAPLATGWALGLALAAPAWMSLISYMAGSGRAQGEGVDHHAWVVPLSALPGLILPCWVVKWVGFGQHLEPHAAIELTGALAPLAGLVAGRWLFVKEGRAVRWDALLAAAALLQCLLPSAGVFRWSFRALPVFHLALGLAGAQVLALIPRNWRRNPGLWAFGATALAWALLPAMRVSGNRPSGAVDLPVTYLALTAAWALAEGSRLPAALLGWVRTGAALGFIVAAYLCLPLNPGVPRYPFTGNLASPAPLDPHRLYLSLYDAPELSYHGDMEDQGFGAVLRLGSTGMFAGVHLINGYSPVHPAGIGRTLWMGTHGQVPPLQAAPLFAPGDDLLDRLGVDGLIIGEDYDPAPVPGPEWQRVFKTDEGAVYHRTPRGDVRATHATVHVLESGRLTVAAEVTPTAGDPAPIELSFRRPYLPGYRATLNGHALAVGSDAGYCPTVQLPPGSAGVVRLRYLPAALLWGTAVAASGALAALLFAIWPRLRVRWRAR